MTLSVKDFFVPIDLKSDPLEKDYEKLHPFIQFAKSITQITYQSVYLIDYYKRGFLYVSENPIFLCGKTPKQVLQDGYVFYLKNVPQEDLELLLKINAAGFVFFETIPPESRLDYSISYDFHLMQPNKRLVLINHKLVPLVLDKDANIWIALCIVSLSPNEKAGNIKIRRKQDGHVFEYDLATTKWVEQEAIRLTEHEKEILILSAQGLNIERIAKKIFLSIDTIKFHKKNIFKKLKATSISKAIATAENLSLI